MPTPLSISRSAKRWLAQTKSCMQMITVPILNVDRQPPCSLSSILYLQINGMLFVTMFVFPKPFFPSLMSNFTNICCSLASAILSSDITLKHALVAKHMTNSSYHNGTLCAIQNIVAIFMPLSYLQCLNKYISLKTSW